MSVYPIPGDKTSCIAQRALFADWYQDFDKTIPAKEQNQYVILNCATDEAIQMMFYTGVRAAYNKVDEAMVKKIRERKDLKIAYIVYPDEQAPDFIRNDPEILKIPAGPGISMKWTCGCR
jgi:hypothetical protein